MKSLLRQVIRLSNAKEADDFGQAANALAGEQSRPVCTRSEPIRWCLCRDASSPFVSCRCLDIKKKPRPFGYGFFLPGLSQASMACYCPTTEEHPKMKALERRAPQTGDETRRHLHELQVHQIEIEMQNAELLRTREDFELSRNTVQLGIARRRDSVLPRRGADVRAPLWPPRDMPRDVPRYQT